MRAVAAHARAGAPGWIARGLTVLAWSAGGLTAGCGDDPPPAPPPRPTAVRYAADGTPSVPLAPPTNPRNFLLVILDTLRADALGPFGGRPDLMPRTSRFLETGVAFRQAASTSPWTGPSIASVLTGLLPTRHGASVFADDLRLIESVPTLAEVLRKQGWATRAYAGGGWVSDANGMLQGFELARYPFSFGAGRVPLLGRQSVDTVADRPWFFLLHTYEAHDPYGAPPLMPGRAWLPAPVDLAEVDRETERDGPRALVRRFLTDPFTRDAVFESGAAGEARLALVQRYFEEGFAKDPQGPAFAREMRLAYEAGLAKLDAALGHYFEEAERRGLLRDAVVILLSDHGEGFGEHGSLHHGRRLYDELIHVPLWIRAPGWTPRAVDEPVSLCDVLPTALELLGLPVPEGSDGRSLVPLVAAGASGHVALSEERKNAAETGLDVDEWLGSARDARWKLILRRDRRTDATSEERYDLKADPGETTPLPADPADWPAPFRDAVRALRERR